MSKRRVSPEEVIKCEEKFAKAKAVSLYFIRFNPRISSGKYLVWHKFDIYIFELDNQGLFCLFDLILYVPSTIFKVFLGSTSTKLGLMCLALERT